MEKIYYRPKDSPQGTPFMQGYATYPGGDWVEIAGYNGSVFTVRYRLSELEVVK